MLSVTIRPYKALLQLGTVLASSTYSQAGVAFNRGVTGKPLVKDARSKASAITVPGGQFTWGEVWLKCNARDQKVCRDASEPRSTV